VSPASIRRFVVARAGVFRLFEPVDDQGESGGAKTFNILALMPGCRNIDNNWRGRCRG
jgi:hypothetical protein